MPTYGSFTYGSATYGSSGSGSSASIITVAEAVDQIGLTTPTSDQTAWLSWLCDMATDAIARDLGITLPYGSVTETHDGGRPHVLLRKAPVLSVTTVTVGGTATTDYVVDKGAGILYAGSTGAGCWSWGRQNVVVTYSSGYATTPLILKRVALLIVEQAWQSGQQLPASSFDGASLESAAFNATTLLSPVERAAYNSLRAAAFA